MTLYSLLIPPPPPPPPPQQSVELPLITKALSCPFDHGNNYYETRGCIINRVGRVNVCTIMWPCIIMPPILKSCAVTLTMHIKKYALPNNIIIIQFYVLIFTVRNAITSVYFCKAKDIIF